MKKNLAAVGLIAGLGIGGVVGVTVFTPGASNAQSGSTPTATAEADTNRVKSPDELANEASGKRGFDRHDSRDAADTNEAALLAKAKITPAQAAAAAITLVPGTARTPDLHDREGTLTYRVDVTTATGDVEVRVDALTGSATIDTNGHGKWGFDHADDGHDGAEWSDTSDRP